MLSLDVLETLAAASLVLLLGQKLVNSSTFLKTYSIPELVVGGLLVAVLLLSLRKFAANMQAVTDRFGPSHLAFLIVPMVSAFFIDIVNVIKLFLALPIYN